MEKQDLEEFWIQEIKELEKELPDEYILSVKDDKYICNMESANKIKKVAASITKRYDEINRYYTSENISNYESKIVSSYECKFPRLAKYIVDIVDKPFRIYAGIMLTGINDVSQKIIKRLYDKMVLYFSSPSTEENPDIFLLITRQFRYYFYHYDSENSMLIYPRFWDTKFPDLKDGKHMEIDGKPAYLTLTDIYDTHWIKIAQLPIKDLQLFSDLSTRKDIFLCRIRQHLRESTESMKWKLFDDSIISVKKMKEIQNLL